MPRNVKLLLTENVDNLGIVGDLVNVRLGYARNYLLPRQLAEKPSEDKIKALSLKRADAEKQVAALRAQRKELIGKLQGIDMTMVRACNPQGQLYGSVSQQDISDALTGLGFKVMPREVRLPQTIKRLGNFDVHVKFERDLEATITVHVEPDREMQQEDGRQEMEFDNEGNLVEPGSRRADRPDRDERRAQKRAEKAAAEAAAAAAANPAPTGFSKGFGTPAPDAGKDSSKDSGKADKKADKPSKPKTKDRDAELDAAIAGGPADAKADGKGKKAKA